jgi:hypothetical protein
MTRTTEIYSEVNLKNQSLLQNHQPQHRLVFVFVAIDLFNLVISYNLNQQQRQFLQRRLVDYSVTMEMTMVGCLGVNLYRNQCHQQQRHQQQQQHQHQRPQKVVVVCLETMTALIYLHPKPEMNHQFLLHPNQVNRKSS